MEKRSIVTCIIAYVSAISLLQLWGDHGREKIDDILFQVNACRFYFVV